MPKKTVRVTWSDRKNRLKKHLVGLRIVPCICARRFGPGKMIVVATNVRLDRRESLFYGIKVGGVCWKVFESHSAAILYEQYTE